MNILPRDSFFDFDSVFNNFAVPASAKNTSSDFFSPRVDVVDHSDRFEIRAELAGVKKEDISVDLEDGVLSIHASINTESADEQEGRIIRKERRSGSYMRSFSVGRSVTETDISARFEDGLLVLTVAKVVETAKLSKKVEIQ